MKIGEIQKGVPVAKMECPARKRKWPMYDMEIDDMIPIECADAKEARQVARCIAQACFYLRPKKFKTRKIGNTVRVWRVA